MWIVVIFQGIFGAIILTQMACTHFPRLDVVYETEKSVYLGDFEEKEYLNPQKRSNNDLSILTDEAPEDQKSKQHQAPAFFDSFLE